MDRISLVIIALGLGASVVMDLWSIFLKCSFNIAPPNYCFVGRWLCYMPDGIFRHRKIAAVSRKPAECAVGWIAHYTIGVIFAFFLVLLASPRWLQEPTLLPAMILGITTVALPYFVLQPSFGLGIASSKSPNPTQARIRSLMSHAVFGLGLYISGMAIRFVFMVYA